MRDLEQDALVWRPRARARACVCVY